MLAVCDDHVAIYNYMHNHATDEDTRVQDAYSIRCTPSVHGAARDTLTHCRSVVEIGLVWAIDNPMVLADGRVESCGNFHGAPLGFAADFLAIALAEIGAIAERRMDRMLDKSRSPGPDRYLSPELASAEALLASGTLESALQAAGVTIT